MNSNHFAAIGMTPSIGGRWMLVGAMLLACQTSTNPSGAPPTTPVGGQQTASPLAQPLASAMTVTQTLTLAPGASIDVAGLYFGWKGPCKGAPPTRSAWQLVESNEPFAACIYVDGPMAKGLSPNAPAANTWLLVHGVLKLEGGARYIEADRVEQK